MQDFPDGDGDVLIPTVLTPNYYLANFFPKTALKQDGIPVGCVPPTSVATTRC